jgi:hypothetical protein
VSFCVRLSEWVQGYGALFAFVGVAALDIEDDDVGEGVHAEPDTFRGLSDALSAVQYLEVCAEEGVEESAFAGTLRSDDGDDLVLFLVETVGLLGEVL